MPFPLLPVPTSLAPLPVLANRSAQFLAFSSPRLTGCIISEPYRSTLSASPRPTALVFLVVPFQHPSLLCSLSTSIHPGPQDYSRPHSFVRYSSSSSSSSYPLYILPLSLATSRLRLLRYFLDLHQCDRRATTARPKPHYPALINNPKSILHLSGNVNLGQPIPTRTVQRRPSRTNTDPDNRLEKC